MCKINIVILIRENGSRTDAILLKIYYMLYFYIVFYIIELYAQNESYGNP